MTESYDDNATVQIRVSETIHSTLRLRKANNDRDRLSNILRDYLSNDPEDYAADPVDHQHDHKANKPMRVTESVKADLDRWKEAEGFETISEVISFAVPNAGWVLVETPFGKEHGHMTPSGGRSGEIRPGENASLGDAERDYLERIGGI